MILEVQESVFFFFSTNSKNAFSSNISRDGGREGLPPFSLPTSSHIPLLPSGEERNPQDELNFMEGGGEGARGGDSLVAISATAAVFPVCGGSNCKNACFCFMVTPPLPYVRVLHVHFPFFWDPPISSSFSLLCPLLPFPPFFRGQVSKKKSLS